MVGAYQMPMKRTNTNLRADHPEKLDKLAEHFERTGIAKWSHAKVIRLAIDELWKKYRKKIKDIN